MTAQAFERIYYNGDVFEMDNEPLSDYLYQRDIHFISHSTACWRGYYGTCLIKNDKLYLVDLKAYLPPDYEEVGLDYLFPNRDIVFAEWFTGELCLPSGEHCKNTIMGLVSVYEKELYLNFESGKLVGTREILTDPKDLEDDPEELIDRYGLRID